MKFEIKIRHVKTENCEFDAYKAYSKKGWIDCKFRKEVKNLPTTHCYVLVDDDEFNVNTSGRYPVLWINRVEDIEEIEKKKDYSNLFEN